MGLPVCYNLGTKDLVQNLIKQETPRPPSLKNLYLSADGRRLKSTQQSWLLVQGSSTHRSANTQILRRFSSKGERKKRFS